MVNEFNYNGKPVLSLYTYYALQKDLMNNLLKGNLHDNFMSFIGTLQPGNRTINKWRTECIDAVVDGWIGEDDSIREASNLKPWRNERLHVLASYRNGLDYALRKGIWPTNIHNMALDIEYKYNGEGKE